MLRVKVTALVSPAREVPFASVAVTLALHNQGDDVAHVTGAARIYSDAAGTFIYDSEFPPTTLQPDEQLELSTLTEFDPPAPADDNYFVLVQLRAHNPLVPVDQLFTWPATYFDVKPVGMGPAPAGHAATHEKLGSDPLELLDLATAETDDTLVLAPDGLGGVEFRAETGGGGGPHASTHENGGADEVNVAGLSGVLADKQDPQTHAARHQPGGSDAMTVDAAAVTGSLRTIGTGALQACAGNDARLSDARTPTAHHASHENGGADELSVAGLSGTLADAQTPLAHHANHEAAGADRVQPVTTTTVSSSTPTPSADNSDRFTVTALAEDATFAAPTGSPVNGQTLIIRILDNGTGRTLAWNAAYRSCGATLPTSTTASKTLYVGLLYNSSDSKWDCVAVSEEA
jgi:hypothetical protein